MHVACWSVRIIFFFSLFIVILKTHKAHKKSIANPIISMSDVQESHDKAAFMNFN